MALPLRTLDSCRSRLPAHAARPIAFVNEPRHPSVAAIRRLRVVALGSSGPDGAEV
jgi:hypothetical protein